MEGKSATSHRATGLLRAWGDGDQAALQELIPLVHDELRRLARRYMGRERAGQTLQPTALVNEAYLRLADLREMRWQDRAHFVAMAARLMRRVLVDIARSKGYQKRGRRPRQVSLDPGLAASGAREREIVHASTREGGASQLYRRPASGDEGSMQRLRVGLSTSCRMTGAATAGTFCTISSAT
jgi:DNA-directed RNA polymerase specialized sigma24 family protein